MDTIRNRIEELLAQKDMVLIAIDGKCTSGKTTLAAALAEQYECNVFHMDDFFLRPEQRTEERFAEPGGNVDYERFQEEVLIPLKAGREFAYRPFDCKSFTLAAPVHVTPKRLNIVEGTYSHHPCFGEPYDWKLLLSVDDETQRRRILRRPEGLHRRFFEEWIPMENRYFAWLEAAEQRRTLERVRKLFEGDRFATENGAVIDQIGDHSATCSLVITPSHRNAMGAVMGGTYFMLADFAFAVAANWEKMGCVSLRSDISFLGAAKGSRLIARAVCVKNGRTTALYRVDVTDDLGNLTVTVTVTGCHAG